MCGRGHCDSKWQVTERPGTSMTVIYRMTEWRGTEEWLRGGNRSRRESGGVGEGELLLVLLTEEDEEIIFE